MALPAPSEALHTDSDFFWEGFRGKLGASERAGRASKEAEWASEGAGRALVERGRREKRKDKDNKSGVVVPCLNYGAAAQKPITMTKGTNKIGYN